MSPRAVNRTRCSVASSCEQNRTKTPSELVGKVVAHGGWEQDGLQNLPACKAPLHPHHGAARALSGTWRLAWLWPRAPMRYFIPRPSRLLSRRSAASGASEYVAWRAVVRKLQSSRCSCSVGQNNTHRPRRRTRAFCSGFLCLALLPNRAVLGHCAAHISATRAQRLKRHTPSLVGRPWCRSASCPGPCL